MACRSRAFSPGCAYRMRLVFLSQRGACEECSKRVQEGETLWRFDLTRATRVDDCVSHFSPVVLHSYTGESPRLAVKRTHITQLRGVRRAVQGGCDPGKGQCLPRRRPTEADIWEGLVS